MFLNKNVAIILNILVKGYNKFLQTWNLRIGLDFNIRLLNELYMYIKIIKV